MAIGRGLTELPCQERPCHGDRAGLVVETDTGGRGRHGRSLAKFPQVVQDQVQPVTLDVLHHVEVNAVMLADAVDRYDPGVVQAHRGAGLQLESFHEDGIDPAMQREDFQGDAPAEGFLDGLVDDAHAAVADFAEDSVLAELFGVFAAGAVGVSVQRGGVVGGAGFEAFHELHGREELEDLLGQLRVFAGVVGGCDGLALAPPVDELGRQQFERVATGGGIGHH